MKGISIQSDENGNYLFLNVVKGNDILIKLHDDFYLNEFKIVYKNIEYLPHMTLGKIKSFDLLKNAYDLLKNNNDIFITEIDTISVEEIGKNNESNIIINSKLK